MISGRRTVSPVLGWIGPPRAGPTHCAIALLKLRWLALMFFHRDLIPSIATEARVVTRSNM